MKTLTALQLISETCEKCGVKFNASTGIIDVTDLKIPKKFAVTSSGSLPTILQVGADKNDIASVGVVNFDDLDVVFKKEGVVKASSTHLKLPIALHGVSGNLFNRYDQNVFSAKGSIYKKLNTEEELKEWLESFPAEVEVMRTQHKELSEVLKQIKTEGKQYKDIIAARGINSTEGREARNTYEDMILQKIRKLTKREEILKAQRGFVL